MGLNFPLTSLTAAKLCIQSCPVYVPLTQNLLMFNTPVWLRHQVFSTVMMARATGIHSRVTKTLNQKSVSKNKTRNKNRYEQSLPLCMFSRQFINNKFR